MALPSRLRVASNTSRSPRRNERRPVAPDLEARVEQPGGDVVEADRPGRRPAQQAHAAVDHLARHRPGREAPRPVDDHQRRRRASTARMASAQRAAARRLIGRLAGVGQRQHHRAVGQRMQPAPCARELVLERRRARRELRRSAGRAALVGAVASAAVRAAPAPLGRAGDGPAMTTQAMRCSLAVSARAAARRAAGRRRVGARQRPSASSARDHRARVGERGAGILGQHARDDVVERRGQRRRDARARAAPPGAGSSRAAPSTPRPRTPAARSGTGRARSRARTRRRAALMSRSPRTCSGAM